MESILQTHWAADLVWMLAGKNGLSASGPAQVVAVPLQPKVFLSLSDYEISWIWQTWRILVSPIAGLRVIALRTDLLDQPFSLCTCVT